LTLRKKSGPDNPKSEQQQPSVYLHQPFGDLSSVTTGLRTLRERSKRQAESRTMAEKSQNLQDLFLNSVRKQKNSLTIFLVNGVKLTGVVTSFDNFCVLLRRDGHSQLVYKHAISTIMPSMPVQMFEGEDDDRDH
jgi:host factor-I protein